MAVMETTYHFEGGGEVKMVCPAKREVDAITEMVDLLSRYYGRGAVERMSRELRVRMYMEHITIGGKTREFRPVGDVVEACGRHPDGLWNAQQMLRRSLNFASEVLFNSLDIAAALFREDIRTQSNRNLQETPEDDLQWAEKAQRFHDEHD